MIKTQTKSIYAWAFYDWANSAYATTVMAGFFPIFFKSYFSSEVDATVSTAQLGFANAISTFFIVLLAPLLGAIADVASLRKRFLFVFAYIAILMSAALAFVGHGEWRLAIFIYILGNIGFMASNSFYDSLLPFISKGKKGDFISGLGFAFGYLGGGILFTLNVAMTQFPEFFGLADKAHAVQVSFISVAFWWAIFSLPLMIFVKEKRERKFNTLKLTKLGYQRLIGTLKKIRYLKGLLLFLVAYWLYIDAVNTIIRMAADFGMAIGLDPNGLIIAILMVQFIGFPATLIFTYFTQRWDTKKAILLAIGIYIFIVIWASMIEEIYEFFILAGLIALVQGGIQSLSRSYYMRMIPQEHISEFFGFYNFLGKFASILGPLLLGVTVLITQNSRAGILSILIFLIIGGVLLLKVDEKKVAKEVRKALSTKSD